MTETATPLPADVREPPRDQGIRWAQAGAPLLPAGLRRALMGERLPDWVRRDLNLDEDATPAALDDSVWLRVAHVPVRVQRFVLNLVTYRADTVRDGLVFESGWPDGVDPAGVRWPTRVRKALEQAGLLNPPGIASLTYGALFDLPALGVKSVLDFASIGEVLMSASRADVVDQDAVDELAEAADEEWALRLRADDSRLRDVAPVFSGTLSALFEEALNDPSASSAHVLISALPAIRARAEEIAAEPLDRALRRLLRSVGATERQVEMVAARVGFTPSGPQTLQEVGDTFGVSRERVRQVTAKYLERLRPTYVPQLGKAIEALESLAPIDALDGAVRLAELGIASRPVHPSGVLEVAELLGYEVAFQLDPGDGTPWVLPAGDIGTAAVFSIARRTAGKIGVSNIDEVEAGLLGSGRTVSRAEIATILRGSPKVEFLEDDWFWVPDIPSDRNRLRNVTQRILSVAPMLDPHTIRQGVRRRYRFMGIETVPPASVLVAFYRAHPEFTVGTDGTVGSAVPLDYRLVLGEVDRALVEVFRSTPSGVLDRDELEDAMTKRGINRNTMSVFTTYSPILDHPATNVWCLRGAEIDPTALEAHRAAVATRTRRRRTMAYGWDEDGRLALTVTVGNVGSPVIGIPVAISRYLIDQRFEALTEAGDPVGTVVVDASGSSWGYGPYLRRRGAEEGDALTLRFDLPAGAVALTLGEEEALEDAASDR